MSKRGVFIVFEGIDRSGKSTQVRLLREHLLKLNIQSKAMVFPARDTATGQKISQYLCGSREIEDKKLHELFSQNRWEFKDEICETLQSGKTLIVDRYAYSGVAYSLAKESKELTLEWCKSLDTGLPAPDLVIFLDIPIEEAKKRVGYGKERYEKEEFQTRVAAQYKQLQENDWLNIDATMSQSQIHNVIARKVENIIELQTNKPIHFLW
jgi:dTMP kinase